MVVGRLCKDGCGGGYVRMYGEGCVRIVVRKKDKGCKFKDGFGENCKNGCGEGYKNGFGKAVYGWLWEWLCKGGCPEGCVRMDAEKAV